jgi:hypothetical protein
MRDEEVCRFHPLSGIQLLVPQRAAQYRENAPGTAWAFNPYTGARRSIDDVVSDAQGLALVDSSAPLGAASQTACVAMTATEMLARQDAPKPEPPNIHDILADRGKRYGPFDGHAAITQQLKDVMRATDGWSNLNASQRESLEMIAHKIGRILNGDPNYDDSWVDTAGYAELVVKQLRGQGV